MNAFAKMDIFFVVTTLATVVLAVFMGVLLFYVVRAARDVSRITHVVRDESEKFAKGTGAIRHHIRRNAKTVAQWFIALIQSFGGKQSRTRTKK